MGAYDFARRLIICEQEVEALREEHAQLNEAISWYEGVSEPLLVSELDRLNRYLEDLTVARSHTQELLSSLEQARSEIQYCS
ncbi:MAG: hypothetical protein RMI91_07980 [Gemmatales bacterium]|nr:hypothetical protein [Gemmatales bacterium]MDW7994579.1 hypothetical protein [Gemmatales bacterium]